MEKHDVPDKTAQAGSPDEPAVVERTAPPRPDSLTSIDRRVVVLCGLAIPVSLTASLAAQALTRLIGFFTNLAFYGRFSTALVSPADHHLGVMVVLIPVIGGIIVGLMARFGSKAIRGHGIPEAMEQVLTNESRIPFRLTILKPLSAAISIGAGGPFGAEGPIIATGGALGSLVGQILETTAWERKTLLSAGAAAGMAATFGSPVSAVLLVVELLLFEYRPRSLIPVALAAVVATGTRMTFMGAAPFFAMPDVRPPGGAALAIYVLVGAIAGLASVGVTRAIYAIEEGFERLRIHWMWWPALGGFVVGGLGLIDPRSMGVGYDNIERILSGDMLVGAVLLLCTLKFISWAVSLGSGTSGGTLAPLFTIGGGLGLTLGHVFAVMLPAAGIDARIAALVGMAAIFAGASRALLASIVFAFETTFQPYGILPLLGGCTAAFLVSYLAMRNSIMSEKIIRRGVRVLADYTVDFLDQIPVRDYGIRPVVTLRADDSVEDVRTWLASNEAKTGHNGFPVVDDARELIGLVTRRDLMDQRTSDLCLRELPLRPVVVIYDDSSLRDAVDSMARHRIGRLPVVSRNAPRTLIGIITRSDIVEAHMRRRDEHRMEPT